MAFNVGALSASDVRVVHSTMTRITIIARPSIAQIMNRVHEPELQGAAAVVVHQPDLSTAAMVDRGRDDAYDTATEVGASQVIFDIDIHGEAGNKVYYLDEIEVPWDVIGQINEAQAAYAAKYCGDKIYTALKALTTKALGSAVEAISAAADIPKEDNTGSNNNAGKIGLLSYGSATNKIPKSGVPANNTARAYPLNFIEDIALRWKALSIIDGQYIGGMPAGDETTIWLPPPLTKVLNDEMKAQDLHYDDLNRELYRDGPSIFSPDGRQWEGMLYRCHILTDASLPSPTTDGSNSKWDMFAITPVGAGWAERPMREAEWSSTENETEPAHVMRKIKDAGFQLLHQFLVVRGQIATG